MGITIALPRPLRTYAAGSTEITLEAGPGTVAAALAALSERHPGAVDRVVDETGALRQHVNVFLDGENVRFLDGLGTPVNDGASIVIVPSVSGG